MLSREETLKHKGWTKQSTHDEPRLSDIVEMYQEIGLDVLLEPYNPDEETGCTACMRGNAGKYKTIYTREAESRKL